MQVVILAAGKGKRMGELTQTTPKPLLKLIDKTLLEYKLENLPDNTSEIIIVVGYMGEKIKKSLGGQYGEIPIKYVGQNDLLGTAHSLKQCQSLLRDKFMVLMADDIYDKNDLEWICKHVTDGAADDDASEDDQNGRNNWSMLACPTKKPTGGEIIKDEKGNLKEIREIINEVQDVNLIYTGACVIDTDVFKKEMVRLPGGEYGLPQTITQFVDDKNIRIFETNKWKRVTGPEDLQS
jgi:NDP-sugar pyrophosphorylase family protein